jgi:putative ABC transport system permease protein
MVLTSALGLVCAGVAAGIPVAIGIRHLAGSLIAGMPMDISKPIAFAAAVLIGVSLLAAYLPARKAARVRPMDALRR